MHMHIWSSIIYLFFSDANLSVVETIADDFFQCFILCGSVMDNRDK